VIGSGTSVPNGGRGSPGYIVEVSGDSVAFDLGPGTVHRWPEVGVSCLDVAEVFVSHLHPDHVSDMLTLLFGLRNHHLERGKSLRITGPTGLKDFYRGLLGLYGEWVEDNRYELELKEIEEEEINRSSYTVISRKVKHTASSLGYRLESSNGRIVAYSGDTDYCEGIVELGRGTHVLVLECSVPDEERIEGHLTPALAGEIAAECGAEKLVLTHFYPRFEGIDIVQRVKIIFDGEVILGEDLMRIEV